MPQIVAGAAAAVKAIGVLVAGVAAKAAAGNLAAMAIVAGANVAVGVGASAIGAALTPKVGQARPDIWSPDTDAPNPVAMGRVGGVAGFIAHRAAYGPTNRYQSLVTTVSLGPIRGNWIAKFDDEVTNFGANDVATDGAHAGELWCQFRLGAQPETAHTSPAGLDGGATLPNWSADHELSGKATFLATFKENSKFTEYQGGLAKPSLEFDGGYVWDPREDNTYPGGEGDCRLEDPTTWVWSEDPCIWALNWAIGRWAGDNGSGEFGVPYECTLMAGIGATLDGIDVAAFVNAANVSEANSWTVSAWPTTKDDKHEVLRALLQAGGALPSRNAGRISCITRGEVQSSVVTITAADTAGPVELSLGQSRLERINTVHPRFWSRDHDWQMIQIDPVSDPDFVTEDGEITRARGVDYPYAPAKDQAAQLGYYDIADNRERFSGTVPMMPHMRRLQPGDCFTFNEPGFLLDGVKAKCLRRSIDPVTLQVTVTWRQETDAKHAAAAAQTGTAPPTTDPTSPPGPYVEPPSDLLVTAVGWSVNVAYRNPNDTAFDYVNIFRAEDSTDFNDASIIDFYAGGSGEAINRTDDVTSAGSKSYWLAAFDVFGNVSAVVGPDSVSLLIAELDFLSGFLHLAADVGTVLSDLSGASFSRALAGYAAKADGTLQAFASGAPRVSDQGLLIENAATNLCIRSQEIDHGAWSKSAGGTGSAPTVTANAVAAPDGTMTADRVVFNLGAGTTSADLSIVNSTAMTVANGSAYTASVWLRADTPCAILIRHVGNSTYTLVNVTTTWQRFSVTETSSGTSRNLSIGLRGMGLGSSLSATVDVWQAQVELGSEATSEIVTTTASVTRPVDALTLTLPAGDSADAIEIVHDGGTVNLTRADLANPLLLDLGGASGGAWVGGFIESVTVTPA